MKRKRKKSAFDLFRYGKDTPKDDHPRSHCWHFKPLKVNITKHKQGAYTQIIPKIKGE